MFQNIKSSSNFNNKPHVRSINACRIHQKWQRHRALSESIRYWPGPITFLSVDVLGVFQLSSFFFLQSWIHLSFKGVKILNVTRESQKGWPLTFWLKDQYVAFFFRLTSEYELGSLNNAKFQRYCTGKHAPFSCHNDLDPRKIDMFLYASIPLLIMYQYQSVVQPDRLNYGTIWTCLRKGLCNSRTDCEETTTGLERKWRHLNKKSFEKWWI